MAAAEVSAKRDPLMSATALTGMECLSDEEVLAFANGTLEASRHAEAHTHFDQCEVCQRLLSEAAHALATAVTAPFQDSDELSWHTTFQPGTLVGQRYLIRRFIARGGMGEVYEAFDRDLQERVALKTVTSTACDNLNAVRRLKAEVQLARRVSHPNVCRIYDFGTHVMPETGGQVSFLSMEFVDGETLGQRVRLTGALPINEASALARGLLGGLCAAHAAGVLHRDFKSDNVMLRDEPGGSCSPLILDFGLARALEDGSRASSSNPNLLGTFGYIAPEQLQGRPHTTASDIYSFGIVWFEMLTGELPFESPSSPVGAALMRLQESAAAPSTRNPLVPAGLDAIVLGCLRRSPKDRFRTTYEVLDALAALETRARSASQKRKLMPLSIAAVAALTTYVAASGIGAFVDWLSPGPPDRSSNRRPIVEATMQPSRPSPEGGEARAAASGSAGLRAREQAASTNSTASLANERAPAPSSRSPTKLATPIQTAAHVQPAPQAAAAPVSSASPTPPADPANPQTPTTTVEPTNFPRLPKSPPWEDPLDAGIPSLPAGDH